MIGKLCAKGGRLQRAEISHKNADRGPEDLFVYKIGINFPIPPSSLPYTSDEGSTVTLGPAKLVLYAAQCKRKQCSTPEGLGRWNWDSFVDFLEWVCHHHKERV